MSLLLLFALQSMSGNLKRKDFRLEDAIQATTWAAQMKCTAAGYLSSDKSIVGSIIVFTASHQSTSWSGHDISFFAVAFLLSER